MHYFRIHPDYWEDRLQRAKAMGLNAVEVGGRAGAWAAQGRPAAQSSRWGHPPLPGFWSLARSRNAPHAGVCRLEYA